MHIYCNTLALVKLSINSNWWFASKMHMVDLVPNSCSFNCWAKWKVIFFGNLPFDRSKIAKISMQYYTATFKRPNCQFMRLLKRSLCFIKCLNTNFHHFHPATNWALFRTLNEPILNNISSELCSPPMPVWTLTTTKKVAGCQSPFCKNNIPSRSVA